MERTIFLVLLAVLNSASGANILGILTHPSQSHHLWANVIFSELAKQGHNVTVLAPNQPNSTVPGLHYILAEKVVPQETSLRPESGAFGQIWRKWSTDVLYCEALLTSQGFSTLLSYPSTFTVDLVIADVTSGPCWTGFLLRFGYPPVVGVTANEIPDYIYHVVDGHAQVSYIPHPFTDSSNDMSFSERFRNFYLQKFEDLVLNRVIYPKIDRLVRRHFDVPEMPFVGVLQQKVDLLLVNGHFSLEKHEPLPNNVIPVAGLQIRDPHPLDPETEKFISRARKGIVLFSLGASLQSQHLEDQLKTQLLRAFRSFPDYHFIWKYEGDDLKSSANVLITKWMSQNDILSHPKMTAFISHGGLLSVQEATWYGIPIIGLPLNSDQHKNVKQVVRAGAGVELAFEGLSAEKVERAIREVIRNPSYRKNARKRSELFRDQPEPPRSRALYWISWVLRHPDELETLKVPVSRLGWLRVTSLDVLLVSFLLASAAIAIAGLGAWKVYEFVDKRRARKFSSKRE